MSHQDIGADRFRKNFVLAMTIAYAIAFLAMLAGFFEALIMAAVLSGIVYPFFLRVRSAFGGRATLASLLTVSIVLLAIVVPAVLLLGVIADQAISVAEGAKPWIESKFGEAAQDQGVPAGWEWLQTAMGPYSEEISAKLAELAGSIGAYLAEGLKRLTEGAFSFFLSLFIMLYSMFFFLVSGPALVTTILGYIPLEESDKRRLLNVSRSVSRATIKGTMIIGVIQGALGGLGFAVAGIESAVFWGAVMAVLSVIPGIGATLVWLPATIYLFATGHTAAAVGLFAWCAGVVGTIDNVLRPMLVGRDTEMPDLLILLATLGGIGMFGASGLVIGPMLAALFLAVLTIYSQVFADALHHGGPAKNE